jgi:hypothetical protein
VFFGENSRKCLRTSREIPEIPGKKVFSVFQDDAKIQPISGKSAGKFPGKSDVFGENFPENHKIRKFGNSGKFRKKVPKRRFWKIQPSFAERFKTHFKELKSIKKK